MKDYNYSSLPSYGSSSGGSSSGTLIVELIFALGGAIMLCIFIFKAGVWYFKLDPFVPLEEDPLAGTPREIALTSSAGSHSDPLSSAISSEDGKEQGPTRHVRTNTALAIMQPGMAMPVKKKSVTEIGRFLKELHLSSFEQAFCEMGMSTAAELRSNVDEATCARIGMNKIQTRKLLKHISNN